MFMVVGRMGNRVEAMERYIEALNHNKDEELGTARRIAEFGKVVKIEILLGIGRGVKDRKSEIVTRLVRSYLLINIYIYA